MAADKSTALPFKVRVDEDMPDGMLAYMISSVAYDKSLPATGRAKGVVIFKGDDDVR